MNDLERDLIKTDAIDAFEATVLRQTVATARRARRTRNITRVAIITGLCFAALQLPLRHDNDSPSVRPQIALHENVPASSPRRLQVFRSTTFVGKIHTTSLTPENTLATKDGRITVVRTSNLERPEIVRINDDELLSLFQGKPVALVGRGANAELIFADGSRGN